MSGLDDYFGDSLRFWSSMTCKTACTAAWSAAASSSIVAPAVLTLQPTYAGLLVRFATALATRVAKSWLPGTWTRGVDRTGSDREELAERCRAVIVNGREQKKRTGKVTFGNAQMKLPNGLVLEAESAGVRVVRKMRVEVARRVSWTCSVVCGASGSGRAKDWTLRVVGLPLASDESAAGILEAIHLTVRCQSTVDVEALETEVEVDFAGLWPFPRNYISLDARSSVATL